MHPLERIINEAKRDMQRIVLPESTDSRMLEAARRATDEKIACVSLLGTPADIEKTAQTCGVSLAGVNVVDIAAHPQKENWAKTFAERRKSKGLTKEQAAEILADPLFYGAMMVREGEMDGMVAGAVNSTSNVLRASLQIIGSQPGIKTVSSCFLMIVPDCPYGANGTLMYGDAGVVPDPNEEQLADIAISTAESMQVLVGVEPIVAMLSFSTYGSAQHPRIDKVKNALKIAKEKRPDLIIDGELQGDAALIESIGKRKCPGSPVAGKANTLIFPDLDAGNIAYKLTERLAKAEAYGPLLQGLALPVNDLSRGCSANDIYNTIAITSVQAQAAKKRKA
ncbi:MAG: phosphate acetyltransferase [Candidatus Omnitrophota bacterium]|jgi:phosphate acetyltransferase|nr:MAG: phosphate acetyltransferase [Candidatus Omnitrophota bacterium]